MYYKVRKNQKATNRPYSGLWPVIIGKSVNPKCQTREVNILFLSNEILEGIIGVENGDTLHAAGGKGSMNHRQNVSGSTLWGIRGLGIPVHTSFTSHQPVQIQAGEVEEETLQEIVSRFVAPGEDMGNGSPRNGKDIGQLRLRDIFGLQKL